MVCPGKGALVKRNVRNAEAVTFVSSKKKPDIRENIELLELWWLHRDLNLGPHHYE